MKSWREEVFDGQELGAVHTAHAQSRVQGAGVAGRAAREDKTMAALRKEFALHSPQILEWKRHLLDTDSRSIHKKSPFALSLSKGFDKLSPNGDLCNRTGIGMRGLRTFSAVVAELQRR